MSGPLLHLGATVICTHGGQALPTAPSTRVLLSGQSAVSQASPWTVAGCGFVPPGGNGPCVSATYVAAANHPGGPNQTFHIPMAAAAERITGLDGRGPKWLAHPNLQTGGSILFATAAKRETVPRLPDKSGRKLSQLGAVIARG